jgi:hypothetical protein
MQITPMEQSTLHPPLGQLPAAGDKEAFNLRKVIAADAEKDNTKQKAGVPDGATSGHGGQFQLNRVQLHMRLSLTVTSPTAGSLPFAEALVNRLEERLAKLGDRHGLATDFHQPLMTQFRERLGIATELSSEQEGEQSLLTVLREAFERLYAALLALAEDSLQNGTRRQLASVEISYSHQITRASWVGSAKDSWPGFLDSGTGKSGPETGSLSTGLAELRGWFVEQISVFEHRGQGRASGIPLLLGADSRQA